MCLGVTLLVRRGCGDSELHGLELGTYSLLIENIELGQG